MGQEKVQLTDEGVCRIKERLQKLKHDLERNEKSLRKAIDQVGLGDEQCEERLKMKFEMLSDIKKWESVLKNSKIISIPDNKRDEVEIGSTVELINKDVLKKIQIVCSVEADPMENKISDKSPLGSSVIGRKKGDTIKVPMPQGIAKFTINSVE